MPTGRGSWSTRGRDVEPLRDAGDDECQLHLGEGEADAVAGAAPNGTHAMSASAALLGCRIDEPVGSKTERVGPALGSRPARCADHRISVPFGMR